jgi:glutamate racemase
LPKRLSEEESVPLSKIGVFDSGIGGLSILNEALTQAPGHHYMYLADSANTPYGEKSIEWISSRSLTLCSWLVQQGCEAIVIACNTATAQAIAQIRETFSKIAIIGVEPGIKPAALQSSKKIVGVLATQNTLASDKFKQLLASLLADCEFIQQAGIGLVPLIEQGQLSGPSINALLHQYIDPMIEQGVDTLVLGCTHYPFLEARIQQMYGEQLQIIDTSHAVVKQMCRLVNSAGSNLGSVHFYSTSNGQSLLKLAKSLLSPHQLDQAQAHTVDL